MIKEQVAKMKRFRTIGLALLAVFALSAIAASAAQAVTAPYFTIGGTRLVAGKTHNFDSRALPGGAGFVLNTPNLGIKITCTSLNVTKGVLLGSNAGQPGKDDEVALFTGCTVTGAGTGCVVKEPVETNPLTSELIEIDGTKEPLGEEFKPTTGNVFVILHFVGSECIVPEAEVKGEVAAQDLTDSSTPEAIELGQAATEATSWRLTFPATPIAEVLLVNTKGEKETHKLEGFTTDSQSSVLEGTSLQLLANTKFEPERSAKWSPLP
jgi:hypothetical protein